MAKIQTFIRRQQIIQILLNSYRVNKEYVISLLKKMDNKEINDILA